jgi:hypothetical protein
MEQAQPLHNETIVSSAHGNAAISDGAQPVSISHHATGVVLCPSLDNVTTPDNNTLDLRVGKVHFPLPTLRSPNQQGPTQPTQRGSAVAARLMSTSSLEVSVAPHSGEPTDLCGRKGPATDTTLRRPTKIIAVDLYAGQELLASWDSKLPMPGQQPRQNPLPTDQGFRIHIHSDFYGEPETLRLNESIGGLSVTLTVQFIGQKPAIMVSSVAIIQTLRLTGVFGDGGF